MLIRRFAILLLPVFAMLLLGGCMQLHSETTIDKNGGGKAAFTISMSQSVAEAMKEMQELDSSGGPGGDMPSFSDLDKDEINRKVKEFGVELTKFKTGTVDGRETTEIEYTFKDMKGLSAAMGAIGAGGDSDDFGLGIFDAGDGNLVLRPASYDFPDWSEEEAEEEDAMDMSEMDPGAMGKQMEIMGKMMGAISELEVEMRITVPGDIVSTNAPQQEGRTSIWTVNSSNMMSAGQDMEPEIVFSGKGLKIKPQSE